MKYIDADKLIVEIERLQKRAEHYEEISLTDGERSYWSGENGALELLATFITSFHQEQPEVDLDREIQEHIKECLDVKFPTTDIDLIKKDVAYTARKFYELGLNARKEE